MREVKNMKVEIANEDCIFVNNKQFISLKKIGDARRAIAEDMKFADEKIKELAEENEALKVLLKNQPNEH